MLEFRVATKASSLSNNSALSRDIRPEQIRLRLTTSLQRRYTPPPFAIPLLYPELLAGKCREIVPTIHTYTQRGNAIVLQTRHPAPNHLPAATMLFFRYAGPRLADQANETNQAFLTQYSFFKTLTNQTVIIELKNDIRIRGTLKSVDQYLNIKLDDVDVLDLDKYPHLSSVKNMFIRGSVVRYVVLPRSEVDVGLLEDATRRGKLAICAFTPLVQTPCRTNTDIHLTTEAANQAGKAR